jgi:hypothetical protein
MEAWQSLRGVRFRSKFCEKVEKWSGIEIGQLIAGTISTGDIGLMDETSTSSTDFFTAAAKTKSESRIRVLLFFKKKKTLS